MTDRTPDAEVDPESDENSHDDDESVVEKAKEKLSEIADPPEAADYDKSKANPVTGQRRE